MKNLNVTLKHIALLVIIVLCGENVFANVWRVNNRPDVDADFTSIMQAHQSSQVEEGDTLYVEASSGVHGNTVLSKQLVIIGPGYFLAENPETQADDNSVIISKLTFNDGSQGSIVKGCHIHSMEVNTSDIIIQGNLISNYESLHAITLGENISNIWIKKNYIRQMETYASSSAIRAVESNTNDVIIKNNYIYIGSTNIGRSSVNLGEGFNGVLENNTIYGRLNVNNAQFHNNIIRRGSFTTNNVSYTHNMSDDDQVGTSNGNQSNINMSEVFVGSEGNSSDGRWQLSSTSPAIGVGIGGVDLGMFGGESPYILSGMPNIPSVYQVEHSINYEDQTLEVEFSVKSNN